MKRNLDNLDDDFSEIIQEDEELFDGDLYFAPERQYYPRQGFVEELESRVDRVLLRDEQEEMLLDILMEDVYKEDPNE